MIAAGCSEISRGFITVPVYYRARHTACSKQCTGYSEADDSLVMELSLNAASLREVTIPTTGCNISQRVKAVPVVCAPINSL